MALATKTIAAFLTAPLLVIATLMGAWAGGTASAQEITVAYLPEPGQARDPREALMQRLLGANANSEERIQGFEEAVEQAYPMTPEMIEAFRQMTREQREAMLREPEPEPESSTDLVSLEPGEPSPLVTVAPSIASVIGFYDASGAAWPITQFVVGDSGKFEVTKLGETANNLAISPAQRIGHTNIVVLLEGMDKPVTLRIRISDERAAYRRDIQVMELGPNAADNTATQAGTMTVTEAGNSLLLRALEATDLPENARSVAVEGVDARAWRVGDDLYIRSRYAMLSPRWTGSMRGPSGVRVYRIDPATAALFSVNGAIVRANIRMN